MMGFAVKQCSQCQYVQRQGTGKSLCDDGVDIVEHMRTGQCPRGLLDRYAPEQDFADPETLRRILTQGGCCGAPSE
jgi:hypothetical protein